MTRISQREARRLRKRVESLERQIKNQRQRWGAEYLGGVEISRVSYEPFAPVPLAIRTARKLDHGVAVIADDNGEVRFIALPHPSESIQ